MSRSEDAFTLDDMMEIFGEKLETSKNEISAGAVTAVHPTPSSAHTASVNQAGAEALSEEELAILEAYEKSKREQKAREEEARRKKEEETRRILEQYEKELREAREREARLKKELEERQRRELEELKKKQEFKVNEALLAAEEARIIEEFERQVRQQKEKEEADKRAKEEKAQAELKALAEKQKAEEEARRAEEARREQELKAQAAQALGDAKKESRLMELLAKAKAELDQQAPPPLPAVPTAASAASGGPSAKEILIDVEQRECKDFLFMLEETRKAMFTYLAPLIGIKASINMLNKTVEKARAKSPAVLKDANWRLDGTLREDGSVDLERILANVQKIPIATRVDDFLNGLRAIVSLRMAAVEQGLGSATAAGLRAKVAETRSVAEQSGIKKEWIDLFYNQVVS